MEALLNISGAGRGKGGKGGRGGRAGGGGIPGGIEALKALLGDEGLPEGMDPEELAAQAESMWKMLDEMAENDQEGYEKLLKKQAEEARQLAQEKQAAEDPELAAMLRLVESRVPALVLELPVNSAREPIARAFIEIYSANPGARTSGAARGGATWA
jgi:hypothetical protein